jgi:hypothetical protein
LHTCKLTPIDLADHYKRSRWRIGIPAQHNILEREKIMPESFEKQLENLINWCSLENESNTPDFILAQFILGCLAAWNKGIQQREKWYNNYSRPGSTSVQSNIVTE